MTHILAALAYIRDAAHWTGPLGIGRLAAQQISTCCTWRLVLSCLNI